MSTQSEFWIYDAPTPYIMTQHGDIVAVVVADGRICTRCPLETPQQISDGQLLAAAPELLRACKEARKFIAFRETPMDTVTRTMLDNAITKAERTAP